MVVTRQVAGGWAAFPPALLSKDKLGPQAPNSPRLGLEGDADRQDCWRVPREAETRGRRHAWPGGEADWAALPARLAARPAGAHGPLCGNARPACAHMCAGLSAPSAAESLVYSSPTPRPKLPTCWPPKPAAFSSLPGPHWGTGEGEAPPSRQVVASVHTGGRVRSCHCLSTCEARCVRDQQDQAEGLWRAPSPTLLPPNPR